MVLVAVNPYQLYQIYGRQQIDMYSQQTDITELPPHIFSTAQHAFTSMKRRLHNQSIIIRYVCFLTPSAKLCDNDDDDDDDDDNDDDDNDDDDDAFRENSKTLFCHLCKWIFLVVINKKIIFAVKINIVISEGIKRNSTKSTEPKPLLLTVLPFIVHPTEKPERRVYHREDVTLSWFVFLSLTRKNLSFNQ